MRYGAVLRPPVRGATLRSAEVGPAEQLPGVEVVRDGEFVGVTAPDLVTARRAVAAIRAGWDIPAPIAGPMPDYLRAHPAPGHGLQQPHLGRSGEVGPALGAASITVAATYTTAYLLIAAAMLDTRTLRSSLTSALRDQPGSQLSLR